MKKLFGMFGFGVTTLLARKIEFNPNPAEGEDYVYIEGDKIGFLNWLLKTLGLSDPSIRLSINNKFITKVEGGKLYDLSPTSGIYNFSAGYTMNKSLLLLAILFIWTIILPIIFFILYKRSASLVIFINCYKEGVYESMSIKSGLTGKKLEKSDFENIFNALKNVSSKNSGYFK
jgi:hypothetical protein